MATSNRTEDTSDSKKPRRHRAVIVCVNCRRRKIKCDKGKPCSNCVSSKCAHSCEYDKPPVEKAEDQYTMQLQLDYLNKNQEGTKVIAEPSHGYVGQFSVKTPLEILNENQPLKKKIKTDAHHDTNHHNRTFTSLDSSSVLGNQKSEIQVLKERLEQIEKSLLGSDLKRREPIMAPPQASTLTSSATSKPSLNGFTDFSSVAKTNDYPVNLQNQTPSLNGNQPLGYKPILSERPFGSVLPPLTAPFKHEIDHFPPLIPSRPEIDSPIVPSTNSLNSNFPFEPNSQSLSHPFPAHPTRFDPHMKDFLLIGTNIVGNNLDTMNFYENYSSVHQKDDLRRINFGPFAWSSLMRRDQGLHLVWEHIKLKKENSVALVFANSATELTQETTNKILNYEKDLNQSERQFEKRALETDGIEEIIPYSSILKARKERNIQKQNLSQARLLLGLTYYDIQIDRQLDTIEKIKTVLPAKKVIWKLVQRFFDSVYIYMPYLDEGYFKEDLSRIIGPESDEESQIDELNIERKLDLAVVGILLIILRLAYLSLLSNNTSLTQSILISNDPSPEIQRMRYLLRNPISIDIINVASLCLDQFQFTRRANFTILQLALYLRIYNVYAPEDGEGADGGGSQVLSGILLQMCYQLGLNREPDQTCTNLRMNNLSRKIWYFISLSDVHTASCFGTPFCTDDRYCDTKLPFSIPGGENLIEKTKDKTIIDRYMGCGSKFFKMKDILRETLDVRKRFSLAKFTSMLTSWEIDWYQHTGSLRDCLESNMLDHRSVVDRNFTTKTYLSSRSFLMTTYFHIYLYYEPKNTDVSFFYFKKCLLILTADVMPHYSSLLRNSEVVSDMIINPTLEMFIHKANMVYLSGIIRVNFIIHHMRESVDHANRFASDLKYKAFFQKLCQLSSCLTRAAEYTISAINKLSNRYYYAWRITKSQTVLLKNVTSAEFYRDNYDNAYQLYCLRYSVAQMDELINICENTLASFHNSEFSTFGFAQKADTQLSKPSNVLDIPNSFTLPDGITDLETDRLWHQILSWKHDMLADFQHEAQTPAIIQEVKDLNSTNFSMGIEDLTTPGTSNYVSDPPGTTKLDIFSDIPFNDDFYN